MGKFLSDSVEAVFISLLFQLDKSSATRTQHNCIYTLINNAYQMGQTGLAFAFLFENFLVCIVDRLAIALLFSIRKEGGGEKKVFCLDTFELK